MKEIISGLREIYVRFQVNIAIAKGEKINRSEAPKLKKSPIKILKTIIPDGYDPNQNGFLKWAEAMNIATKLPRNYHEFPRKESEL